MGTPAPDFKDREEEGGTRSPLAVDKKAVNKKGKF